MFFRRYDGAVSDDTITATAQVAIVEETPPAGAGGLQTTRPGVVCEVTNDLGESPKSYFISSDSELLRTLGARSPYIGLSTDGYEGNLAAQCEKMPWLFDGGLVVVTVNAAAGQVTFTRPSPGTASKVAAINAPYSLTPGAILNIAIDDFGAPVWEPATFNATPAINDGAAGAFVGAVAGSILYRVAVGGAVRTASYGPVAAGVAAALVELNTKLIGCHAEDNGGQVRLISDIAGTDAEMEIVTGTTLAVLAELGLAVATATTPATGNVGNIEAVEAAEVETIVEAATTCEVTVSGTSVTLSTPTAGAGGSIEIQAGTVQAAMGLVTTVVAGGTGTAPAGTIPAGTRVTAAAAGLVWLTLEDLDFAAGALTGSVRVRAAGGTAGASGPGLINTVTDQPAFDPTFTVANALAVTAADLDTVYAAAAAAIVASPSDQWARTAGRWGACRHTAAVQSAMTAAVVARSAVGRGAIYAAAPPIGTDKTVAMGSATVGVAAAASGGRSDRKVYCWPPYKGRSAVTGTTAFVDFPLDLTALGCFAHIDPEESPNDAEKCKPYMGHIVAFGADAGALAYADYVALKAAGVMALFMDPDEGTSFQDAVTSSLTAGRTQIPRRTMVDYIGDSCGVKLLRFKGKPFRESVREDAFNDVDGFNEKLKRDDRIADYTLADTTVAADRALGILRLVLADDLLGNIGSVKLQISASAGNLLIVETGA